MVQALIGLCVALVLGCFLTLSLDQGGTPSMGPLSTEGPYDMKPAVAPVVSGFALDALLGALRLPIVGKLILSKLMKDNGIPQIHEFRNSITNPSPMYYPYVTPASLQAERPQKEEGETFTDSRIFELHQQYKKKTLSPVDVIQKTLDNIADSNARTPPLLAFVHVDAAGALAAAKESAARFERGAPRSLMEGVPVGVKVEFSVKGMPFTLGSFARSEEIGTFDAEPVARLRAAGAIIVGLTNMHEIGIGITGYNDYYGTPRNPHNVSHHTGGSSSGSAAAVAAGLVPVALSADGGGSIRIPAGLCGVVGLKGTFGRVPSDSDLCWTIGSAGPIAATVDDIRIFMGIVASGNNPTYPQPPLTYPNYNSKDLSGLRVGVFNEFNARSDPEMFAASEDAVRALVARGASVVNITIPYLQSAFQAHVISILGEMSSSTTAAPPGSFGKLTQINLLLAGELKAKDYVNAQVARRWFYELMANNVFPNVDVIVTPNTGIVAPPIVDVANGESNLVLTAEVMRFQFFANLIGIPGIAVPWRTNAAALPISVQILGPHWSEATLMRVAKLLVAARPEANITPKGFNYGV